MEAEPAGRLGAVPLGEAAVLKVRAFFGLPLPETHRELLDPYIAACAVVAPQFRWTPASNQHLTVRFLGHVEQSLATGIMDGLERAPLHAFELRLGGIGAFKRGRAARVVWIGLAAGEEEIGALAATVEAESVHAGLPPEDRRYHAHLTLARARAREGSPLPELPQLPGLPAWRAEELVLYRSHLGRAGSVYEPLRTLTLGGP